MDKAWFSRSYPLQNPFDTHRRHRPGGCLNEYCRWTCDELVRVKDRGELEYRRPWRKPNRSRPSLTRTRSIGGRAFWNDWSSHCSGALGR